MVQWSQQSSRDAGTIPAGTGVWNNWAVQAAKGSLGVKQDKEITQIVGSQAMHSLGILLCKLPKHHNLQLNSS